MYSLLIYFPILINYITKIYYRLFVCGYMYFIFYWKSPPLMVVGWRSRLVGPFVNNKIPKSYPRSLDIGQPH